MQATARRLKSAAKSDQKMQQTDTKPSVKQMQKDR